MFTSPAASRKSCARCPLAGALALALSLFAVATPAPAQQANPGRTPPKPAPEATFVPADQPFSLAAAGLTMLLPEGASVQAAKTGDQTNVTVIPPTSEWMIVIRTPRTSNPQTTISQAVERTLEEIAKRYGLVYSDLKTMKSRTGATTVQLLDHQTLDLQGGAAERVYIRTPTHDGSGVVLGYTFFKPTPSQFVVFEFTVPDVGYERLRPLYEAVVATAEFADPDARLGERGAAVMAGENFLQRLHPEDYDRLMDGRERWYRVYQPAPGGSPADATEIGYFGLTFWKGQRGEINRARDRKDWALLEAQEGYLVRLRGRYLQAQGFDVDHRVVDIEGLFFMTPDRQEEAWTLTTVVRDSNEQKLADASEIGSRDGSNMSVMVENMAGANEPLRPLIQGDGYLSQVETFLLPLLLIEKQIELEFAFYRYMSSRGVISLRTDSLAHNGNRWTITSRLSPEQEPQVAVYSTDGELIRIEDSSGQRTEPASREELMRLWRSKGLPTGAEPRRGR